MFRVFSAESMCPHVKPLNTVMTLLNDFSHVPWIGWIVQADENVSRNFKMLHNHTGFKPFCVLKRKKQATWVFTGIQLHVELATALYKTVGYRIKCFSPLSSQ